MTLPVLVKKSTKTTWEQGGSTVTYPSPLRDLQTLMIPHVKGTPQSNQIILMAESWWWLQQCPLLPDLQMTQAFIDTLRAAVLEGSGMKQEDIDNLRRPEPVESLDDLSPLLWSLRHFVNNDLALWDHYNTTWHIELLNDPNTVFMSWSGKAATSMLSGVVPIEYDMCPNTCIVYTGPRPPLKLCPHSGCNTSR